MVTIEKKIWGEFKGKQVWLFHIYEDGQEIAAVSNYGCRLQKLMVTDRTGKLIDVVLGYDTLEEYINSSTFFGAVIGPIADRLDRGSFVSGSEKIEFPLNAGPDSMHCGDVGFHNQVWNWNFTDQGIVFGKTFSSQEFVFRSEFKVEIEFVFTRDMLEIKYRGSCDREVPMSFTNHTYFNLSGGVKDCRNYIMEVEASEYAETIRDVEPICNGIQRKCENTPFELKRTLLSRALEHEEFDEIRTGHGIDHYFIVDRNGMRKHAAIECPDSGIRLECLSDAPGLLIYTGNGLIDEKGKNGKIYGKNWAICLETERFPNAVNFDHLRKSVMVKPGEFYESRTVFRFSCVDKIQ